MIRLLIDLLVVSALGVLLWPFLERVPLGTLPGDVELDEKGFRFRLPWVTCLVLAVAAFGLSEVLLLWLTA